jgi:nucleoid DNA-binding protein
MGKVNLNDMAGVLMEKHGLSKTRAQQFLSAIVENIQEGVVCDKQVKIKGLGTFRVIDVDARESVNVNTGERVLIGSHAKLTFTPDNAIKEMVNRPFSQFETVILNEGVTFDAIDDKPEDDMDEAAEDGEMTTLVAQAEETSDCLNVVELAPALAGDYSFVEALRRDQQWAARQTARQQMHYKFREKDGQITELLLQAGDFFTLNQLLSVRASVVESEGFAETVVGELLSFLEDLHATGVYHLCFAPQTIFFREGSNMPMLLTHGSFYQPFIKRQNIYVGFETYVAPEVLSGEMVDERSDIFALGSLIACLGEAGVTMPAHYGKVARKATSELPSKRYQSVDEMKTALTEKKGIFGF